ncbi:MAG: hypothetical protein R6U17_07345 [Thermoplasmata archaeon]
MAKDPTYQGESNSQKVAKIQFTRLCSQYGSERKNCHAQVDEKPEIYI